MAQYVAAKIYDPPIERARISYDQINEKKLEGTAGKLRGSEGKLTKMGLAKRETEGSTRSMFRQRRQGFSNIVDDLVWWVESLIALWVVNLLITSALGLFILFPFVAICIWTSMRDWVKFVAVPIDSKGNARSNEQGKEATAGEIELASVVPADSSSSDGTLNRAGSAGSQKSGSSNRTNASARDNDVDYERAPLLTQLARFSVFILSVCSSWLIIISISHFLYLSGNPLPLYAANPLILGHRGVYLPGNVPECSYAAVDEAKKAGFHAIEFDVRYSKDNKLVVMHDVTLGRTTNYKQKYKENPSLPKSENVDDWTLDELKQLTLIDGDGTRNETVYTLSEYLLYIKKSGLIADVDIKQGLGVGFVQDVLNAVCETGMEEYTMIATAEVIYQDALSVLQPHITIEADFLYHTQTNSLQVPFNNNVIGMNGEFLFLNPWLISAAHRNNQYLLVYLSADSRHPGLWSSTAAWASIYLFNDLSVCIEAGLCPGAPNVTCHDTGVLPSTRSMASPTTPRAAPNVTTTRRTTRMLFIAKIKIICCVYEMYNKLYLHAEYLMNYFIE